jgi:hypothetical protein
MPRFFLNFIKNGAFVEDPEGDEVPDLQSARQIALDTLQEMRRLPHIYEDSNKWEAREFVITDENGSILMKIPFSYLENE